MAVESICNIELPVDEVLEIKKNRFQSSDDRQKRRMSIVTGIHGDELEGQFVCYEVARRLKEHPEYLTGIVDIYPAMNPLGIDSMTRGIPGFDLDMNRIFPGSKSGAMTEYAAYKIIDDLTGSDLCIDIHASNIFLTEIPQIRINELHTDRLVPMAEWMNVDFVWIHGASTVLESTLAYSLNSTGTPTLVVEMGVGMRITKKYCYQLVDGIFNAMKNMGIWQGDVAEVRKPIISDDPYSVVYFNAPKAGLFVPSASHWEVLEAGDEVGIIADPMTGDVLSRIVTESRGILFTIREYPIVGEGSLVGRLLKQ
jgi:hypothetical protein